MKPNPRVSQLPRYYAKGLPICSNNHIAPDADVFVDGVGVHNRVTKPAVDLEKRRYLEGLSSHSQVLTTRMPEATPWQPDLYVDSFVPQSLTAINGAPALVIETPAVERIDFESFISSFTGSHFLTALEPLPFPNASEGASVESLESLCPSSYLKHFDNALALDIEARLPETRSYDLFRIPFELIDDLQQIYGIQVPGLRDGTPLVNFGDTIMIRQLIMDHKTGRALGMDGWLAPGGGSRRGEQAPGFTGYQMNAIVTGIDKRKERLFFRAHGMVLAEQLYCNVSFAIQDRLVQALQRAVTDIAHELGRKAPLKQIEDGLEIKKSASRSYAGVRAEEADSTWLQRVLFPKETNGVQQLTLPSAVFSQTWFDTSLNYEQKKAVDAVQSGNYGDFCYLINGPPGTGKTKTICEIVAQLGKNLAFQGSILLCAPSNPAADALALRLRHLFGPKSLLRLNDFSRTFAEVPQDLLLYCYVEKHMFNLPPLPMLMGFKVVVTTCQAADILVQARVTNRDLVSLQGNLAKYIHPGSHQSTIPLHWTALIVDEAAQATEPENLIPLSVVGPPATSSYQSPVFVMAGDQHQLNPRTYSRFTTLPTSLFERLSEISVYASHPLARKRLHRSSHRLPMLRPPFVNLIRNYRSHPAILAVPSSLFYSNTLIPEASHTDTLLPFTGWGGRRWPVLFACNAGIDSCEDIVGRGRGWYNMREAQKAIAYAQSLLGQGLITDQSEICIMSPFQAQVNLLRKLARQSKLFDISIGPMEAFQGLESRFVIVCTTRARKRFLDEDRVRGIGIVNEKKKFNVAITRAKEGLVVLGNPWVLAVEPCWLVFLEFCWRNGLWRPETSESAPTQGVEETFVDEWKPGPQSSTPSGLEAALLYKESDKSAGSQAAKKFMGGGESMEDALWRSGIEAQEAIDASIALTDVTAEQLSQK